MKQWREGYDLFQVEVEVLKQLFVWITSTCQNEKWESLPRIRSIRQSWSSLFKLLKMWSFASEEIKLNVQFASVTEINKTFVTDKVLYWNNEWDYDEAGWCKKVVKPIMMLNNNSKLVYRQSCTVYHTRIGQKAIKRKFYLFCLVDVIDIYINTNFLKFFFSFFGQP